MTTSALLLATLLASAQAGPLELTNIRATHGLLGSARPDFRILPGEVLQIGFDIGGLQPDEVGRLRFAAKLVVEDMKSDKPINEEDLGEMLPVVNVLGGGKVPHAIVVNTGLKQTPGQYRVKVTITDLQGQKKEASFSKDFTILPLEFGFVRFQLSHDRFGQLPAPPVAGIGQTLYVGGVLVGYKVDAKDQPGAATVELNILDERDRPTLAKPLTGVFKNLEPDTTFVTYRFELPVHRAGRFKLQLKANDTVGKKMATLTIPFTAQEAK